MNRNQNGSATISKKEQIRLVELRLQKEKILKDMKISEERRQMKHLQKHRPIVITKVATEPVVEPKIRKLPKFEIKSFAEIMQEANEKEMLKKRSGSTSDQIPPKKHKSSLDHRLHKTYDSSLQNTTSSKIAFKSGVQQSNSINKNKTPDNELSSRNFKDTSKKIQGKKVTPDLHSVGVLTQNSSKSLHKLVNQFPNRGIISQNGVKQTIIPRNNHKHSTTSAVSRGILAQNRITNPAHLSSCSEEEQDSDLDSFIDHSDDDLIDDSLRKEIYESLRYDPSKYAKVSVYDDCKNMESSSKQIQIEETKSMKMAKVEDLKEARLEMERLKRKGKL